MERSRRRSASDLPVYDPEGWRNNSAGHGWNGHGSQNGNFLLAGIDGTGLPWNATRWHRNSLRLKRWARGTIHAVDWWRAANYVVLSLFLAGVVLYDRTRYDVDLRGELELPHPLDILKELRTGDLKNSPERFQRPGFVGVREGTFRDKYPSLTLAGTSTFDEIFAITNEKCSEQLEEFSRRAKAIDMKFTKVVATAARDVNLDVPPLPIRNASEVLKDMSHAHQAIFKRQVGYTYTHYQIWMSAFRNRRQRILVVDDTLFPRGPLVRSMPQLFNWVDQESIAGQQPWHFMFFRRKVLNEDWAATNETFRTGSESTWSPNPQYNHRVVRAKPSYGAGFYAMSFQGLMWILEHFKEYRAPLDVQISMLQREYPREFIALSACNNDQPQEFCPEIVQEIQVASSSGYDCIWRRMQEVKISKDGVRAT